jgi:hypothetical protein
VSQLTNEPQGLNVNVIHTARHPSEGCDHEKYRCSLAVAPIGCLAGTWLERDGRMISHWPMQEQNQRGIRGSL